MYEKFVDLLVEELQIDRNDIKPDSELSNDLGINSVEMYELAAIFEDRYGLVIAEEDVSKFNTVSDIVTYLENLQK